MKIEAKTERPPVMKKFLNGDLDDGGSEMANHANAALSNIVLRSFQHGGAGLDNVAAQMLFYAAYSLVLPGRESAISDAEFLELAKACLTTARASADEVRVLTRETRN